MYKFNPDFYADIRIEDRYETNISYKNKVLEEMKVRKEKRAFIRVYDGNIWYYASTSEVKRVQEELDKLYLQATPNPNIAANPIVKKYQVNKDVRYAFNGCSVRDVDRADKVAIVEDVCAQINNDYVKFMVVKYVDRNSNYEFYSSKGADIKYDFQTCGYMAAFAMVDGAEQFMGSYQAGGSRFDELKGKEDEIAKAIRKSEEFLLNAKPCVKGDFPVVLSPITAGIFAHESFGHKSEADFMLGDETMKREWALGSKVGSDILSIVDTGADFGTGYVPYDDEGTACTKTYLIKDGVLTGRLHSGATAAALEEELTGNARAMNCKFEPIVRMTTTYIEGGTSTLSELIEGIKDGYYIESIMHGSGMSQFTLAPSLAYEIKDGKIGAPVKISVITGSVFETLGLIDGLSETVEMRAFVGGGCGKMEQYPLNVGFGGPYVRVSKMNVQ